MISVIKRNIPPALKHRLRTAWTTVRRVFLSVEMRTPRSRLRHYQLGRQTTLFFAPEAGVIPYLRIQSMIGKTLQEKGSNAVFVRCFDMLRRCPVKEMVKLPYDATPAQARNVCVDCWSASKSALNQYDLDFVDAREYVDQDARQRITEALKKNSTGRLNATYDDVPVGSLAFYDFAIANKHPIEAPLTEADNAIFDQYLETLMMSIEMLKGITSRYQVDTLASFDEYGLMSAGRLFARGLGIDSRLVSFAYHLDGDMRRIVGLSNLSIVKEQAWRVQEWSKWRALPLTPDRVKEAGDDVLYRLSGKGSHIYSSNKTLHVAKLSEQLGLEADRKTLTAFTSSRDEHDALLSNIAGLGYQNDLPSRGAFLDTFDWLHAVIAYVESSVDLQLVVRLHPRIASTPRDNTVSKDYARYRDEFVGPYLHTRIIWPEEKVSSYDIAELSDLALISWSSMGLELARMSVPVLSGYPSIFSLAPDEGFLVTCLDRDVYFDDLRRLLAPAGIGHVSTMLRMAYRWYYMAFLGNSIDVSDLVPQKVLMSLPIFKLPRNASVIEEVFTTDKSAMDSNLSLLESDQSSHSFAQESIALAEEILRLLYFIGVGSHAGVSAHHLTDFANSVEIQERGLSYVNGRERVVRYSPMMSRLWRAYAELTAA